MTAKKTVYIEPGDMIEIRLCPPGFEKNARDWSTQVGNPNSVLIRVHGRERIAFADPFTRLADWSDPRLDAKGS